MTARWLPDDCQMTARWLPDDCRMTAWWLTARWLPDDCGMTAGWLRDDCLMTAGWPPDDCRMTAGWLTYNWLPVQCLMSTCWILQWPQNCLKTVWQLFDDHLRIWRLFHNCKFDFFTIFEVIGLPQSNCSMNIKKVVVCGFPRWKFKLVTIYSKGLWLYEKFWILSW